VTNSVKDWGGEEAQEKFMTTVTNLGLGVIDDSASNLSGTMQYGLKVLDMDESDRIQRLINLAMLIEQQGFMQLGITPQRQGQIQASETATGTNTAVSNSYAVTEIYFEQFTNYRRRKLQMLLELAQYVEAQGEGDIVKQYTTSDLGQAFIKINKTDLLLKDLGVYVMNSAEQQRKKDLIEQLILKNNQTLMPLSKLIELVRLDNLTDIQKKIEEQESAQQKQAQEQQKQAMELEQSKLQQEAADKQADRDLKKYEIDTKANTELQKVSLQGIANESSFNPDVDLTDKLIAQKDIALKENQIAQQNFIQQSQLTNQMVDSYRKSKLEENKLNQDKLLKKQEAQNKKEIEDKKLKQIITQNKSQEKINSDANKAKLELANKQMEMKELELKAKKLDMESSKAKIEEQKKLSEIKIDLAEEMSKIKQKEAKVKIKIKPKLK
jgi:hypothetical protein